MSYKKHQQSLRRPDLLQIKFNQFLRWSSKHPAQVKAFGFVLVLGLVGSIGGIYLVNYFDEKTREELSAIDMVYNKEIKEVQTKQEALLEPIKSLYEKLAKLKEDKTADHGVEIVELSKQVAEVEDKVKVLKPDHAASSSQYLTFYEAHKTKATGWRAGLVYARQQIEKKEYAPAAKIIKEILVASLGYDFYQTQVRHMYIGVLVETGDITGALQEADTLIAQAKGQQKPKAIMAKAKILMISGQKPEAAKLLDQILTEFNSSSEAQKARVFKALLRG